MNSKSQHVIWFNDIPRDGFWRLNPNEDRKALYIDENGNHVVHPYAKTGRMMTRGEYHEYLWTRGLPIGNGRLGAMVIGAIDKEVVQINESSVWTGSPYVDDTGAPTGGSTKGAWKAYRGMNEDGTPAPIGTVPGSISCKALQIDNAPKPEAVQQRYALAAEVERNFLGTPMRQHAYQSFVELFLDFRHERDQVSGYSRCLDLSCAVAKVEYDYDGVHYEREYLASYPDQVIAVHLVTDHREGLKFTAELHTFHQADAVWEKIADDQIALRSKPKGEANAIRFEARMRIDAPGALIQVSEDGRSIHVSGVHEASVYIVGATNYMDDLTLDDSKPSRDCERHLASLSGKRYDQIKQEHIADHRALYERTALHIENGSDRDFADVPTDKRVRPEGFGTSIEQIDGSTYTKEGDHALAVLQFNLGKYLLIAGSRPGGHPLTLQGLWNATNSPAWSSKYTININTEMNYWPARILNLGECEQPLLDALHDLFRSGQITAREHYAIEGSGAWVMHHNFDLWRGTQPIDNATAGLWPTGGVWLLFHAWQAYQYTNDPALLARFYPYMTGAAQFFTRFLVTDPRTGYLITAASVSPEHGDVQPGPAMDSQLIRFLYEAILESAEVLGRTEADADLLSVIREQLPRLAPNLIDQQGYIQEWVRGDVSFDLSKDLSEHPEFTVIHPFTGEKVGVRQHIASNHNSHKHMSHMWDIYPGTSISLYDPTEEGQRVVAAFKRTIEARGSRTGPGWSLAWRINLRARMGDGDGANELIKLLLDQRTSPNLFDQHPPFQIDGNFGVATGIAEMLLQSHDGALTLLPALPRAWTDGEYRGFRARGSITVDVQWRNRIPERVRIVAHDGGTVRVRHPLSASAAVRDEQGRSVPAELTDNGTVLVFAAAAGVAYVITGYQG